MDGNVTAVITKRGDDLRKTFATSNKKLMITRVVFGKGHMSEDAEFNDFKENTKVLEPIGEGEVTSFEYNSNSINVEVEFNNSSEDANQLELDENTILTEIGVYAGATENGTSVDEEILFYYVNMGDRGDPCPAFNGGNTTVRQYVLSMVVGALPGVTIDLNILAQAGDSDGDGLSFMIDKVFDGEAANIPDNVVITTFNDGHKGTHGGAVVSGNVSSGVGVI